MDANRYDLVIFDTLSTLWPVGDENCLKPPEDGIAMVGAVVRKTPDDEWLTPREALRLAMDDGDVDWSEPGTTVVPTVMLPHQDTFSVWCKYCDSWHHHGTGEGHQAARCTDHTPYSDNGYTLDSSKRRWLPTVAP